MNNIKKHFASLKIYGISFIFYGIVASFFVVPMLVRNHVQAEVKQQLNQQVQMTQTAAPQPTVTGKPIRFNIERLGINFPVAQGRYNATTQKWALDSQHVFVNTVGNPNPQISTAVAEQPKLVVFYGHNFMNVVGNTKNLVVGDILNISTDTGYRFRYYYTHDQVVKPQDTSVFSAPHNKDESVTLITCTGAWDQVRRIMYFAPLGQPEKIV